MGLRQVTNDRTGPDRTFQCGFLEFMYLGVRVPLNPEPCEPQALNLFVRVHGSKVPIQSARPADVMFQLSEGST